MGLVKMEEPSIPTLPAPFQAALVVALRRFSTRVLELGASLCAQECVFPEDQDSRGEPKLHFEARVVSTQTALAQWTYVDNMGWFNTCSCAAGSNCLHACAAALILAERSTPGTIRHLTGSKETRQAPAKDQPADDFGQALTQAYKRPFTRVEKQLLAAFKDLLSTYTSHGIIIRN